MVTAGAIVDRFGIPRSTLYQLIREGRIEAHDVGRPDWHRRRRPNYRFRVSEVKVALERIKAERGE